jgi:LuxR family transcriptional regulator, maltose regulon positive regulatory protein
MGREGDDMRSARAQLQLAQSDSEAAYRWADAYADPVPDRLLTWLQDPHVAKAQILLARGTEADVQTALDILNTLHEIAERSFQIRFQIEVLALRAVALVTQGRADAALASLRKAIELSQPGGLIRVFVDLGSHLRTRLLPLAVSGPLAGTVRRIVTALPQPGEITQATQRDSAIHAANSELVESLTTRELEVLALLAERLSNKEIARILYLSTSTVKRHTTNLYGKLSVDSRRDAVVRAEALGILPPG